MSLFKFATSKKWRIEVGVSKDGNMQEINQLSENFTWTNQAGEFYVYIFLCYFIFIHMDKFNNGKWR